MEPNLVITLVKELIHFLFKLWLDFIFSVIMTGDAADPHDNVATDGDKGEARRGLGGEEV